MQTGFLIYLFFSVLFYCVFIYVLSKIPKEIIMAIACVDIGLKDAYMYMALTRVFLFFCLRKPLYLQVEEATHTTGKTENTIDRYTFLPFFIF